MDRQFMNRRIVVDNVTIIVAVLRKEIVGYYDQAQQAGRLFTAQSVAQNPDQVKGMRSLSFNQTAAEQGWTAEEIAQARRMLK